MDERCEVEGSRVDYLATPERPMFGNGVRGQAACSLNERESKEKRK